MASYYAQIDETRRVVGVTQTTDPVDDPRMVPLPSYDLEVLGKRHDLASGAFVEIPAEPAPQPTARNVSNKAFLSRFTDDEAIDIDLASIGATREAATVRRYLSKVNAAQHIDLAEDETRTGVQALEAAGLLKPGRALSILDTPIEPKELP
jgi:hypothetical protein